jgi:aerobic-type carbon monoxide dehydrogenase small subunit (CoxS/CutS family)
VSRPGVLSSTRGLNVADERAVHVRVNGREYVALTEARTLLSDFLRHGLGLTGTHVGCEHGVCGACTVLVDGRPTLSCLVLAVQAEGAEVLTVEGLADGDGLHPIQQAFRERHGLQCGFCTPGMLIAVKALLDEVPDPSEDEIRHHLAGNVCRCTGYVGIVEAVHLAAEALQEAAR